MKKLCALLGFVSTEQPECSSSGMLDVIEHRSLITVPLAGCLIKPSGICFNCILLLSESQEVALNPPSMRSAVMDLKYGEELFLVKGYFCFQ